MALRSVLLGAASNIERIKLFDASSTIGGGLKGLAYNSTGLIISTICDNESAPTVYTALGSTIETISTLGTYAAPTATKCRFREIDQTNHPGEYEFQFADARYAVSGSKYLTVTISGATNLVEQTFIVEIGRVKAGFQKNTACLNFEFFMRDAADHLSPKTLLTLGNIAAQRSIDGAVFGNCANAVKAEVGNGFYSIDLAASDLNGDIVTLRFAASGADPYYLTIKTN